MVIRDSKGLYRNHKMLRESSYIAKKIGEHCLYSIGFF